MRVSWTSTATVTNPIPFKSNLNLNLNLSPKPHHPFILNFNFPNRPNLPPPSPMLTKKQTQTKTSTATRLPVNGLFLPKLGIHLNLGDSLRVILQPQLQTVSHPHFQRLRPLPVRRTQTRQRAFQLNVAHRPSSMIILLNHNHNPDHEREPHPNPKRSKPSSSPINPKRGKTPSGSVCTLPPRFRITLKVQVRAKVNNKVEGWLEKDERRS